MLFRSYKSIIVLQLITVAVIKICLETLFSKKSYYTETAYQKIGTRDAGRLHVGPWDPTPGTPICLGEIRGPRPPKWDPEPVTPKYLSGTRDLGPQKWNLRPRTPTLKCGTSNFL